MNQINKIILYGLLLCLLGAAGKGYGQEVKPGDFIDFINVGYKDLSSYLAVGEIRDAQKPSAENSSFRFETRGQRRDGGAFNGLRKVNKINNNIEWEKTLNMTYAQPLISSNNTVIYAAEAIIHAFDINTGEEVWVNKDFQTYGVYWNMAHGGHYLYVTDRDSGIFAIDPKTGKTVWSTPWDFEKSDYINYGNFYSPVVVDYDETIYGASSKYIYAINGLNGEVKWIKETQHIKNGKKWGIQYSSPLLTDSDIVYYVFEIRGSDEELNRMSDWERTNDENNWKQRFSGIYAINTENGEIIWNNKDYGSLWTEAVLDENNDIISYDNNGYSVLLKGGLALADSPWPMSGQNPQLTSRVPTGELELVEFNRPKSDHIERGSPVRLSVKLNGEWPRTYQWERNGQPIPGATQPSLTIENATSKDSGLYRVTITNKHGSVTSDEAVLKVIPKGAPQIFADGKEVVDSVVKGDKAEITLSTSFEGGGDLLYVGW